MEAEPPGPPEVSFRGIEDGDEPRVLELLHAAFGMSWPGLPLVGEPIDYLRWKIRSPLIDSTDSTLMEIDRRPVGLAVRVAREAILRGKKYLVSAGGGDTCVHPDYQGMGLYRRLTNETNDLARRQFSFSLSDTTHPAIEGTRQSRGVHPIAHPLDRMLRPLASWTDDGDGNLPRRTARRLRFRWRQLLSRLRWRPHRHPITQPVREIDRFDERVDVLSDRAAQVFDLILVRDAKFLNWRYCDQRAGRFRVTTVEDGGELLGYCVIRWHDATGTVADLLAAPGRTDVVAALLQDAVRFGDQNHVEELVCILPRYHPYMETLHRLGFVRTSLDTTRAYKPWDMVDQLDFLESDRRSRIHFMQGDGDMV